MLHNMLDVFPIPILSKLKSRPQRCHNMTPKSNQSFAEDRYGAVYAPLHLSHRPFQIALHGVMVLLHVGGGTPITVTPGWSINMKANLGQLGLRRILPDVQIFHIGQLKGTMRVGKGA